MLVLSRKAGEQIVLPDCHVTVCVLEIGKTKVRLGVTAPHGTAVHRIEVWRRICPGQEDAAETEEASVTCDKVQDEGAETCAPVAVASDLDVSLADWVTRRTGGSMPSLAVEMAGDGIVMSGSSN